MSLEALSKTTKSFGQNLRRLMINYLHIYNIQKIYYIFYTYSWLSEELKIRMVF
jgi:hypothetical protein